MRSTFTRVFLAVALAAASAALTAQTIPAGTAAKIDAVVAAEQARQKIPGLSIAVV